MIQKEPTMRNRKLPVALFSASLMLGAMVLPAARADDPPKEQTKDQKATTTEAPSRPENGGLQFAMLQRVRKAVDELKLSDEQKAKIDKMFTTAETELKEARESANGDRQAIAQKARETFNKLRDDLMSVLDEDQKQQLRSKLQTAAQRGGDLVARLRGAMEKLELNDDQKKKVRDLFEDAGKQARDLRDKARAGDQEARDKLRTLMQGTRQKLGDVLTEEQKQKLRDLLRPSGADNGSRQPAPQKSDQ
jgi:Spy/CpxP family protein refolding chaperone